MPIKIVKAVKSVAEKKEVKEKPKKLTQRQLLEDKIEFLEKHDPKSKELKELKKTLVKSKRGRASKSKGSSYERTVASIFKEKLSVELTRTPQSGGFAKKSEKASEFRGDVVCLDEDIDFKLHVECKNQKQISMPSWIRQAEEDVPKGKIPTIVFHRHNTSKEYIVLDLEDFLDIVDRTKIIEEG